MQNLRDYYGNNPFILKLKSVVLNNPTYKLTDKQSEYLKRNFLYEGYRFGRPILVKLNQSNIDFLNSQKIQINVNEILVEGLYGETSDMYHCTNKEIKSFFLYKEDIPDLFLEEIKQYPLNIEDLDNLNIKGHRLFPYQIDGVKFSLKNDISFNWDDMGLGKTRQSICTAIASNYKKILVITLAGLKINWSKEIKEFNQTSKIINSSKWNDEETTFTIINYEILTNFIKVKDSKKDGSNILLDEDYDMIIFDEVHRAKNPKSQQSKAIKKLCSGKNLKKIIGLSGTPFEKNIDFFNICRTLDVQINNLVLNSASRWNDIVENYNDYAFRYCNAREQIIETQKTKQRKADIESQINTNVKKQRYYKRLLNIIEQYGERKKGIWSIENIAVSDLTVNDCNRIINKNYQDNRKKVLVLGQYVNGVKVENTNSEELHQRIKAYQIRRKKKDVLEYFPEKIIFPLFMSMGIKERLEYKRLIEEYLLEQGVKEITEEIKEKMLISIKIRQFLSLLKVKHTADFVKNKVEDGKKVIVFTHFKDEYDMFLDEFGEICLGINATMSNEKKQEKIDKFQTDEKVKIIVGNIKTLGTGHNLTKADIVIFNSPNWNSGEHEQGEDRAYRIGRSEDVNVFYALFENTHEEEVFDRANSKKENKNILIK
jgi:SWI/SNF-related matrix-associated actin-dependent regulator 1 of chromatin subfamily A